jgi:hypothetical protein
VMRWEGVFPLEFQMRGRLMSPRTLVTVCVTYISSI